MTTNIHGQPLWYGDFSNIRVDSHAAMDIDTSGGCHPPSIGDVRQMVVSEPASGSNQMYSDGQPPSVNDVCRREPSQSEASCNRYEGPDDHEVQQVISASNGGVYKTGSVDAHARLLHTTLNPSGVWPPPLQPFQPWRMRTYTRVYKRGAVGRSIDITAYAGYDELKHDLARRFGIEGQLEDRQRIGWKLVYVDHENDVLLVGGDPWDVFVNCVQSIKILSPQEVQQMELDSDRVRNSVVPNQDCSSSGEEQFKGRLLNFF